MKSKEMAFCLLTIFINQLGSLAQLVEQLAFNQLVGRSSRPRPTILKGSLLGSLFRFWNRNLVKYECIENDLAAVNRPVCHFNGVSVFDCDN